MGALVLSINASQGVAWHSPDAAEREEMRAAIRKRARALLERSERSERVEIREAGCVLEVIELDGTVRVAGGRG